MSITGTEPKTPEGRAMFIFYQKVDAILSAKGKGYEIPEADMLRLLAEAEKEAGGVSESEAA